MNTPVTRENWSQVAKDRGLTLVGIAKATGTSYRSVSAYSQGTRRPSDAFIARVGELLAALLSESVA
jgi:transcriptional regulator with XRE-family HTH domain